MLTIKNLSIYIDHDLHLMINDFSFSLSPGDKAVLIGKEGNGKSTLLKAIHDQGSVANYATVTGIIAKKGEVIGYLPQQKEALAGNWTTSAWVEHVVGYENLDYIMDYSLLDQLGLDDYLGNCEILLSQLSGGEYVKFLLLVELLKKPTLLLLDEPSNDLDFEALLWLERFISETSLPVLFISHDQRLIQNCANVIIHLERLKNKTMPKHTIVKMDYQSYQKHYRHNIERQSQLAHKQKEEYQKKFDRYNQVYQRVNHELNTVSRKLPGVGKNLKDKMHAVKSQGRRLKKQKDQMVAKPDWEEPISIIFPEVNIPQGKKVLDFHLDQLVAGSKLLARDVNMTIFGNKKVAIVGANGAGKTTLLKAIGQEFEKQKLKVGYMPQNYLELFDDKLTPVAFIAPAKNKAVLTQARTFLASSNFTREEMSHSIGALSGGQKAKLFFLKMIFNEVEVLLLDEPTRNLSPLSAQALIKAMQNYQGVVLGVSHDRSFLEAVFSEYYLLGNLTLTQIDGGAYGLSD